MPNSSLGDVLSYLRKVCASQEAAKHPDAELLARFLANREDAAFAALVQRHGPMVLSVCQRVLADGHAAEDAFQATFMVLARRAASVLRSQPLAGWLHGVARRIAAKAAAQTSMRRHRERQFSPMPSSEPHDELTWQELRTVLDEEIGRLPEKYRLPVVLCYLEGQTHEKAAMELGVAKSSLTTRLARARELLRGQLARRGISLSIGALTTALADHAFAAPMAAMLAINTVKAAASVAAGKAVVGGLVSACALLWAEQAMTGIVKAKMAVCVCVLAVGVALGGAELAGYGAPESANPSRGENVQPPPPKVATPVPQKNEPLPGVDVFGDPLPAGVVGRLGTTRFRAGGITHALAFTPDGKILAGQGSVGMFEGGLFLWDAVTGRLLHHASASPFTRSLAISPDGKLLFGFRGQLQLIEVPSGQVFRELEKPDAALVSTLLVFVFAPDGKKVAAAGWDRKGEGRVVFWDVQTGKVTKVFKRDVHDALWTAAFSPDGKILATGGDSKIVCLWDVESGKILRQLEGHSDDGLPPEEERLQGRVDCVAFAATGKVMASLGLDCTIRLWDYEAGKMLQKIKGNMATMRTMAISLDGLVVATGGRHGTLHLWDANTGKNIRTWQAHQRDINSLAFSPDGKTLASTGQGDRAVRRWDIATAKEIKPVQGPTGQGSVLRFSPDSKSLLCCGSDAKVFEWDLATFRDRGRLFKEAMGPKDGGWHAKAEDLSSDGQMIAVMGQWWSGEMPKDDSVIRLFEVATGKEIRTLAVPKDLGFWKIRFSPDRKLVVAFAYDGIHLWDVNSGKGSQLVAGTGNNYREVAFSPDSRLLVMTDDKSDALILWDIAAKKELRRWASGQRDLVFLHFAPDGKSVVSVTWVSGELEGRANVRIWATDSGKELARFNSLEGEALSEEWRTNSVAFSESGRVMAVSISGRIQIGPTFKYFCKIHLLELISGQKIGEIETGQGSISALAFAPNGRTLASAGADSAILLWGLTGQPKPTALSPKDLDVLWSDLAADASKAEKSIWKLAFAPKQSLPFLKERLLVPPAPAEQLAKLIADLDSDRYAVRQDAVQALEKLADRAEVAIWKALKNNPTLEAKQRLEQILKKQDNEVLRKLRAIETLEHIGTPEADQLLAVLAKEIPNPRLSEAAAAALQRLAKRR